MEVVIRSPWQRHARAGEHERVTQLAAHSISDGKWSGELHHRGFTEQSGDFCEEDEGAVAQSLLQSWRAGGAIGSVWTTAGLPISMGEFNSRLSVTFTCVVRFSSSALNCRRYTLFIEIVYITLLMYDFSLSKRTWCLFLLCAFWKMLTSFTDL